MVNRALYENAHKAEIERLEKIIGRQAIPIKILKNGGVFRGKVTLVDGLRWIITNCMFILSLDTGIQRNLRLCAMRRP